MKDKNKIAVIGLKGLPAFGGGATIGENIINKLKDRYDFTVYAVSSHTDLKTGMYNGFMQIVLAKIPFKRLNTLLYYIRSFLHALFKGDYDLIHLHHSDAAFIIPFLKLRYKVIVTPHGAHVAHLRPKWRKYRHFFQAQVRFLKNADTITITAKPEKRYLENKIHREIFFIPNGINIPADLPPRTIEDEYLFFGAGRIIKTKGLEILLKALHRLNYTGKLVVAGDLEQTKDYKQEILSLSDGLNVQFMGMIKDKNELLSLVKHAKIFVFPSSMEAMSMMLLEGASVKTPIISSDIQENKDIFTDEHVLFFRTDDNTDLAEKIKYAVENMPIMEEKAGKAFEMLLENNDWKKIADRYAEQYEKLLL